MTPEEYTEFYNLKKLSECKRWSFTIRDIGRIISYKRTIHREVSKEKKTYFEFISRLWNKVFCMQAEGTLERFRIESGEIYIFLFAYVQKPPKGPVGDYDNFLKMIADALQDTKDETRVYPNDNIFSTGFCHRVVVDNPEDERLEVTLLWKPERTNGVNGKKGGKKFETLKEALCFTVNEPGTPGIGLLQSIYEAMETEHGRVIVPQNIHTIEVKQVNCGYMEGQLIYALKMAFHREIVNLKAEKVLREGEGKQLIFTIF